MAISEDTGNQPATAANSAAGALTTTTASFSPAAGTMVVVLIAAGFQTSGGQTTIAASDSLSNTWTSAAYAQGTVGSSAFGGASRVLYHYFASAPGSMTVTATITNSGGGVTCTVRCLLGCSSTLGASIGTLNGFGSNVTTGTTSLTTTQTGSWVYGCTDDSGSNDAFTANGSTTVITDTSDSTNAVEEVTLKATSATGTPGSLTLGGTWSVATSSTIALAEFLPAAAATLNVPSLVVRQAVRRASYY